MVRYPLSLGLVATIALALACNSTPSGNGGAGDTDATTGGDSLVPLPEGERCLTIGGPPCAVGFECVAVVGAVGFCLEVCTKPAGPECSIGRACGPDPRNPSDPTNGLCLTVVDHYELCGTFALCLDDAWCDSTNLQPRCTPICAVGTITGKQAVMSCSPPPSALTQQPPACVMKTSGVETASFCTVDVHYGDTCEQFGLVCDEGRPDTDLVNEAMMGGYDPGAMACLLEDPDYGCRRVCSVDGGTTTSPCACPMADALCADPVDPGVAWSCQRWPALPPGVRGCVQLEACPLGTECADNTSSGMTTCFDAPYATGPARICVAP